MFCLCCRSAVAFLAWPEGDYKRSELRFEIHIMEKSKITYLICSRLIDNGSVAAFAELLLQVSSTLVERHKYGTRVYGLLDTSISC